MMPSRLPCLLVVSRRQIGVVNFEPLKPYFMEVYQGSQVNKRCPRLVYASLENELE
jgi:hypothetical protein